MTKSLNPEYGYHTHYPATVVVVQNDGPLSRISATGPVVDGESWLVSAIADLLQWLSDHDLFVDRQMAGAQIAGETAPFHRDRSPQSPAFERYYFTCQESLM